MDELLRPYDAGVLVLDGDGDIDYATPQALDLLGCTSQDECRKRWAELQLSREAEVRAEGPPPRLLDRDVTLSTGPRRLRFEFYPDGDVKNLRSTVLIRDRDRLERLTRDLALSAGSAAQARVMRAVMHDIRAPLNTIVLNLELLGGRLDMADGLGEADRQRCRKNIEVLKSEAGRLNGWLKTLHSQVVAQSDARKPYDLKEILLDRTELIRPSARQRSVEVAAELPPSRVQVLANREHLKLAFLLVPVHMLEGSKRGGRLDIQLTSTEEKAQIMWFLTERAETSEPVPEELISDSLPASAGTEAGLQIVEAIAKSHGGELQVLSEPGRGDRFQFNLPILR